MAFVQRGTPLMTLPRKQVDSGSCLQNRTLSSSSPLTDESPHISVVYSMAGREAHKCGQVLLPKLDLW